MPLKFPIFLASFAAGTLLGTAFFDLLPEASQESGEINIFLWTLVGILAFFLIERFIHHHHEDSKEKKNIVPLIILGDSIHNFVDGVAIAATFLISIPLGIVTSLAVAAHEIPQEIADFGLMLHQGVKRSKILWINLLSASVALLGAILTFLFQSSIEGMLPAFLAITAGFFIYIAASDLIPEIHSTEDKKKAFWETIALFVGVFVVYLAISSLEGV